MTIKKERSSEHKALSAARILKQYHENKAMYYSAEIARLEPLVIDKLNGGESIGKFENGRFI
jgi:hypothetical protein